MVLGRLIRLLQADRYSVIRLKWLTKLFLLGDIASILLQGMGKLTYHLNTTFLTEYKINISKAVVC